MNLSTTLNGKCLSPQYFDKGPFKRMFLITIEVSLDLLALHEKEGGQKGVFVLKDKIPTDVRTSYKVRKKDLAIKLSILLSWALKM